jgi:hypothetical protein
MFTAQNPDKAAASFQPYAPKTASLQDLQAMVRYHTHHHHPTGAVLKQELKAYADDLKVVSVFKPTPIQPNLRSGSMSTYSASKAVALAQSAEEGAAIAGTAAVAAVSLLRRA